MIAIIVENITKKVLFAPKIAIVDLFQRTCKYIFLFNSGSYKLKKACFERQCEQFNVSIPGFL